MEMEKILELCRSRLGPHNTHKFRHSPGYRIMFGPLVSYEDHDGQLSEAIKADVRLVGELVTKIQKLTGPRSVQKVIYEGTRQTATSEGRVIDTFAIRDGITIFPSLITEQNLPEIIAVVRASGLLLGLPDPELMPMRRTRIKQPRQTPEA